MDVRSPIYDYLTEWVIEPVTEQFLGIFNLNGRLGVLFLFMSYSVAYCLFRFRKHRGLTDARQSAPTRHIPDDVEIRALLAALKPPASEPGPTRKPKETKRMQIVLQRALQK